jgi:membrane protease YdiL (CAAX protease family)
MKAVITTSMLFGVLHGSWSQGWSNIPKIVAYSLVGSTCGLLKVMTGKLWAPVAAHVVYNIIFIAHLRSHTIVSLERRAMEALWRNTGVLFPL